MLGKHVTDERAGDQERSPVRDTSKQYVIVVSSFVLFSILFMFCEVHATFSAYLLPNHLIFNPVTSRLLLS